MNLVKKTLNIAALSLVAGALGAVGNALAMRYLVPLVEEKLPSRTTERDEQQDTPIRAPGMAGMPPR